MFAFPRFLRFKKMKKELGDIEAEVFTLSHTEEVLSQQEGIFADGVKKIERKQGVTVSQFPRVRAVAACTGLLGHALTG